MPFILFAMFNNAKRVIFTAKEIVLSLSILLLFWFFSLSLYDMKKERDALAERSYLMQGLSPYTWDFSSRTELDGGHGIENFEWSGGVLSGNTDDPYFYLNLQGRYIDASRYRFLELRLFSEHADQLRIFYRQLRDDQIYASELIDVVPGWQILTKDLSVLSWELKQLERPEQTAARSSWGGEAGLVTHLRIDPVRDGDFKLDWLKLRTRPGELEYNQAVVQFKNLDDEIFNALRQRQDRGWVLARDNWLRTAEFSHWQRMQIAREFPSAVVFPRVPESDLLRAPPKTGPGWYSYLPATIYAIALILLLFRTQFHNGWRSACEIALLILFLEAYVFWAFHLAPVMKVLVALPLVYIAWTLRPESLLKEIFGDARAWMLLSPLLVLPLVLLLINLPGPSAAIALLGSLGVYLVTALGQQYLVAGLLFKRFESITAQFAIILTSAAFGFTHLPNFTLMAGTFLFGMIWLRVYRRYGNLLAIAASHAAMAVCFDLLAPVWLRLSGSVGTAFLNTL